MIPMTVWLNEYHESSFRVLFQNADNSINMVKLCHESKTNEEELEDLAWFRILADIMLHTYKNVQNSSTGKLITLGEENGCPFMSCYVELHRLDFLSSISHGPYDSFRERCL